MATLLDQSNLDSLEVKWAKQLIEAIFRKKGYSYKDSLTSWAKEFAKLKLRYSPETIQRTLDYFCQQIDDKRSRKQAVSAFHFRKHFEKLQQKAQNYVNTDEIEQLKSQVTEFQWQVLQRLLSLPWPKGSFLQLPKVYVNSILYYKKILAAIQYQLNITPKYIEHRNSQSTNLTYLRFERLKMSMPSVTHFVAGYFEQEVLPTLQNWTGWNGDLSAFEIDLEKPFFRKVFLDILQQKLELRDYSEYIYITTVVANLVKSDNL